MAYPTNAEPGRRVVAVGLLTEFDLSVLGQGFKHAYRIDAGHNFSEMIAAIDAAERNACA